MGSCYVDQHTAQLGTFVEHLNLHHIYDSSFKDKYTIIAAWQLIYSLHFAAPRVYNSIIYSWLHSITLLITCKELQYWVRQTVNSVKELIADACMHTKFTTQKFFTRIIFKVKISRSTVVCALHVANYEEHSSELVASLLRFASQ